MNARLPLIVTLPVPMAPPAAGEDREIAAAVASTEDPTVAGLPR